MAQTFTLDRHTDPSNPTAVPANNEKIKNYETISDMEGDLTNVDDGEVISTEEADYASVHVSNEVTDGDLNPVTSNAVYDAIEAAKIDRVKGAFVEERTNRLWTDGRPIYRQYIEGSPEPTFVGDRVLFALNVPMPTGDYLTISLDGYWEITQNTAYPTIVGNRYTINSNFITGTTPTNPGSGAGLYFDQRYPSQLNAAVCLNKDVAYGLSEHIKICAVIEYTKMSDTPVEDPGVGPLSPSSGNIAGVIINDGVHYSTTETPTGGTWIDGKPIYRRVLSGTATTYVDSGTRRTWTVIDNIDFISDLVDMTGSYVVTNASGTVASSINGQWLGNDMIPFAGVRYGNYSSNNNHGIWIYSQIGYTSASYKIIIEYTKP